MKTTVVVFPFDLLGSGGTAEGATLLADAVREMLADNRRERVPTRADCYTSQVRLRELSFETLSTFADWRKQGLHTAQQVLRGGHFLVWITGNHLGALPCYDALAGWEDTLVVQLDAHLDVHNFHDCTSKLSHGNFLLHCAIKGSKGGKSWQGCPFSISLSGRGVTE
jgi:arginase family enzyme